MRLLKAFLGCLKKMFNKNISILAFTNNSTYDKTAIISYMVKFYNSSIGKYSYISNNCFINNTQIGSFVSIAYGCNIGGGGHAIDWVSTSPVFVGGKKSVTWESFSDNCFSSYQHTIIGNDVWIGTGASIKTGVNIGTGAVIGMGSVVTKDVPPYEIWAGNPAKCIRKRFDDETIERLLKLKWWEWDDEKLKKCGQFFNDPIRLLEQVKGDL